MEETVGLRIGGVPEHFNLPWHQAIEQDVFEKQGLSVTWQHYPGGTGAMAKDLRSNNLDVAVLLTEGIVADISKGNDSKIIGLYVASPLIWGIHVPAHSAYRQVSELEGKRYAISRMGSGSHLMAYVDAKQRGWQLTEEQLVLVGDLNGAREAFKANKADIFMWEKFMTQPFVDNGEFRRVGECLTPWPCFVIAARNEVIQSRPKALKRMLAVIYESSNRFMQNPEAVSIVSRRFGIKPDDAATWFAHTRWATSPEVSANILANVVQTLFELQLVEKKLSPSELFQSLGKGH